MGKTAASIFGEEGLHLTAPRSWGELSQEQLRYVFTLMTRQLAPEQMKTMMFLRFTGISVIRSTPSGAWCSIVRGGRRTEFFLQNWQITSFLRQFDYVDSCETMGVRLDKIQGAQAVDVILNGVAFIDYLSLETWYQRFLLSTDVAWVDKMASVLYRDKDGSASNLCLDAVDRTAVLAWFSFVKAQFARMFPHFFKPADTQGELTAESIRRSATAQLRVLTDGDVSKLDIVKDVNCLDALSELNEKAREAMELRKISAKK